MPALFVLLLGMVGYAAATGDVAGAVRYLFAPDFSALSISAVLAAFGAGLLQSQYRYGRDHDLWFLSAG